MDRLKGKITIVTEVSDKLGKMTAIRFAKEGAKVVVSDSDSAVAESVAEEIKKAGGAAVAVQADITCEEDCKKIVGTAVDAFGGVDVMFANVDYQGDMIHDICHVDPANLRDCFEKNFIPTFNCFRAVVPVMVKQRNGSLIARGSMFGECSGNSGYGPMKAATRALADGVAMEVGRYNIRANTLAPGFLKEDVEGLNPDYIAELIDASPMYDLPCYEDVINTAVYLASDESDCISALSVLIDKGATKGQSVNKTPKRG